jgi:hypothetical protein
MVGATCLRFQGVRGLKRIFTMVSLQHLFQTPMCIQNIFLKKIDFGHGIAYESKGLGSLQTSS